MLPPSKFTFLGSNEIELSCSDVGLKSKNFENYWIKHLHKGKYEPMQVSAIHWSEGDLLSFENVTIFYTKLEKQAP